MPRIFRETASRLRINPPGSKAGVTRRQTTRTGSVSRASGQVTGTADRPTMPSTSPTTSLLECGRAKPRPTAVEPSNSRWRTWQTTRSASLGGSRPDSTNCPTRNLIAASRDEIADGGRSTTGKPKLLALSDTVVSLRRTTPFTCGAGGRIVKSELPSWPAPSGATDCSAHVHALDRLSAAPTDGLFHRLQGQYRHTVIEQQL
jgi:hypothetical protein